ncbi:hypothetical protein RMATCC62417_12019 [Rhizopus microsporus]|nr:hypothetical protein RMATCC62417_12019 [Rhizopus microsporus]
MFEDTNNPPYQFYKLRSLKLPTLLETYANMEETNIMIASLATNEDMSSSFIYHAYTHLFKPTINFKKEE